MNRSIGTLQARREVQRLWPDRLIDAGTGDTVVGFRDHAYGADPCMLCIYREDPARPSGVERIAEFLGLPAEILADGERMLATRDLAHLDDERRRRLEPHVGTAMCGLARATGLTDDEGDGSFMPSVPFVSLQAACLSVGRLVAHRLGIARDENLFQHDALIGPQWATKLRMGRVAGCYCDVRAQTIARVRDQRARGRAENLAEPLGDR